MEERKIKEIGTCECPICSRLTHEHDKLYLGDGVFAFYDDYGNVVLVTEDGATELNRIVLEPPVLRTLLDDFLGLGK